MEAYVLQLMTANPWIIWVGLALILGLLSLAIYQNREFGIFGFKFGAKAGQPAPQRGEITQTVTQNPVQTVNIHLDEARIAPKQIQDIVDQVAIRVSQIKQEAQSGHKSTVFAPPDVIDELVYLFKIQVALESSIRRLVRLRDKTWFPLSSIGIDEHLEHLADAKLVDEQLLEDIVSFQGIMEAGKRGYLSPPLFHESEYLALHIFNALDAIFDSMPREHTST